MDSQTLSLQTDPVASFERSRIDDAVPHVHLLASQQMVSMITAAGSGYVDWEGTAVTRWQADRTRDAEGYFLYLRDLDSGKFWSAGYQPTLVEPDEYQANFHVGSAELVRSDNDIRSELRVCLAPDSDVELRRCTITNRSDQTRRIEITSYAELVLHDARADASHPAFSKLFVQTEYLSKTGAIVARRRKRSERDNVIAACHFMVCEDGAGPDQFETDRCRFIGRGQDLAQPVAMKSSQPLSGTVGSVLDPVASLRRTFILPPHASACVTYFLGVAGQNAPLTELIRRFSRPGAIEEAFASTHKVAQQQLTESGLSEEKLAKVLKLGGALLYGAGSEANRQKNIAVDESAAEIALPADLPHNLPLLAFNVSEDKDLNAAKTLLQAYWYFRKHRLPCNMVLLNQSAFREDLDHLLSLSQIPTEDNGESQQLGQVRILEGMDLSDEQIQWMYGRSRMTLNGDLASGSAALFHEPISRTTSNDTPSYGPAQSNAEVIGLSPEKLQFDNGIGGFSADGTEYVLRLSSQDEKPCMLPPMPWVNVVSNESAGFLITETGAGYTWVGNSRENRLTPWYNDPVSDPHGEALYLRDEDSGVFWSPTPGPACRQGAYEVRHGFGYTTFRHESHELSQEVTKFVPPDAPLVVTRVKLCNKSNRPRRLSLFAYHTWELSAGEPRSLQQIGTSINESRRAVFASNHCPGEYSGHMAFASLLLDSQEVECSSTTDRTEFLGRNGSLANPGAVRTSGTLSGRAGNDLDPCAASQAHVELQPGESLEYAVLLGQKESADEAVELIDRFSSLGQIEEAFVAAKQHWRKLVSKIQVKTPAPEIDLMVNGWLAYQNLSCRIWGRSAYYQAGGAFGFRDQLQDSAALVYHDPGLTRRQIMLHAAHQFREGDVLHWWHPPFSRGIRTRFSDDLIWLPLIAAEYAETTGDDSFWQEEIRFLTAVDVPDHEAEIMVSPEESGESGSLYEHCCRSLDRSLTQGDHGLPLIGSGDWNDGMNRVGQGGLGESVWLGFFLDYTLGKMLPVCEEFGDTGRIRKYTDYREDLRRALNDAGWDGKWYRRAYFDDGTPLGTADADECRIDALVQAWAVLSGVAPADRAASAVAAVEERLIDDAAGMIRLLHPPFDRMEADPGYIKGYVPGVRENGGQYTHGVLWFVRAMAELGHGTRATQLLKMLSPVSRTVTPERVATYKTEPYVVAADVYGEQPHVGRGGWSWYTGSAGWMYRVAMESILGMGIENGDTLRIDPRIDSEWTRYTIVYRLQDDTTEYEITVVNPQGKQQGVSSAMLDGDSISVTDGVARIPLLTDGNRHQVRISL